MDADTLAGAVRSVMSKTVILETVPTRHIWPFSVSSSSFSRSASASRKRRRVWLSSPGAFGHGAQRIVCHVHGQAGLFRNQGVQSAQQRSAAAFNQVQIRIDLIGPVDGDINCRLIFQAA